MRVWERGVMERRLGGGRQVSFFSFLFFIYVRGNPILAWLGLYYEFFFRSRGVFFLTFPLYSF